MGELTLPNPCGNKLINSVQSREPGVLNGPQLPGLLFTIDPMRPIRFGVQIWSSKPVQKIVEQVRFAEELGFDTAWIIDSQLLAPDIYVKLTACAFNTKRITLAAGVTNTVTRNPTVTAGALASLADLAPGRIRAAISLGGSSVTTIGVPHAKLAEFRKDVELIARLLRGEQVHYNAKEIKLVWANPEATRKIPLSIQGHGPKSQQLAGEMGYPLGVACEVQRLGQVIEQIKTGAAKARRPVEGIELRWSGQTSISNDWQVIKEQRLSQIATLIRERYRMYQRGAMGAEDVPVELELAKQITEGYQWLEHASAGASHARRLLDYPDDQWRQWLKGQFIGTPQEVREVVREGLKHDCIQEVVLGLHVSTEQLSVEQNMEAFAKRVRPFL